MDFAVEPEAHASGTVLAVRGELDIATVEALREQVHVALAAPPPRLVIDLTATSFIDSTGCRELRNAARNGSQAGVQVELVVPTANWRVRRVVDFMQFGDLLPVHDAPPFA